MPLQWSWPILGVALVAAGAWALRSKRTQLKVLKVLDGDTFIVIDANGRKQRARLRGCDCPEMDQRLGAESRDFVAKLIEGRWVPARTWGKDRYGRRIVEFWTPIPLSRILLREGLAWPLPGHSARGSLSARLQRKGVWGLAFRKAPWEAASRRGFSFTRLRRLLRRRAR